MNERLVDELVNLANNVGSFRSPRALAAEAVDEIQHLNELVNDKCKLLADIQRELGMRTTDGMDYDPVEWCKGIKRELDRLNRIRAILGVSK